MLCGFWRCPGTVPHSLPKPSEGHSQCSKLRWLETLPLQVSSPFESFKEGLWRFARAGAEGCLPHRHRKTKGSAPRKLCRRAGVAPAQASWASCEPLSLTLLTQEKLNPATQLCHGSSARCFWKPIHLFLPLGKRTLPCCQTYLEWPSHLWFRKQKMNKKNAAYLHQLVRPCA